MTLSFQEQLFFAPDNRVNPVHADNEESQYQNDKTKKSAAAG